ncbi:MAG: hypothetical protein VYE22_30575 [Myxococcota bacterium]|nr:hypothetical protein [Myxococcota bacterium]
MVAVDERYLEELRAEFPGLRLIDKERDAFSRLIDRALRVITFGGQSAYLTRYVTTMGQTLYFPTSWRGRTPESRYVTLRHEAVHLRQFRRYGRVGTALIYLLPIVPLGLAWGRARLEWEAYRETLRATAELHGIAAARDPKLHAHIRTQFVGPAYGWMWPFPGIVQGWIDRALEEIAVEIRRGRQ